MHKDSDLYVYLLDKTQERFGRNAPVVVSKAVSRLDDLVMDTPDLTYHSEKAVQIHRIVSTYARAFKRILKAGNVKRGKDFDWLAEHYGHMMHAGSDDTITELSFASMKSTKSDASILLILPLEMHFDSYIRMYETGLNMPGSGITTGFDVHLYSDRMNNATAMPFRNIYIKIKAE